MCEICRRTPHDLRCPNAPDPEPIYLCAGCGEMIMEGERFFRSEYGEFCENCIYNANSSDLIMFLCECFEIAKSGRNEK